MRRFVLLSLLHASLVAAPIKRIWLSHATNDPSKLMVNWETATASDSIVEFGLDASCSTRVANDERVTLHHVEIPLAAKDSTYHYRVRSGDDVSSVATFKAYPTQELRVAVVGDWGYSKSEDLSALVKDDPHLLLTVGDNVASLHEKGREGTKAFSALIDRQPALFRSVPFMPILGNHDREITPRGPKPPEHAVYDVEARAYREFFALPDDEWKWRFDLPDFGLRFLALDASHTKDQGTTWQTNHPIHGGSEQWQWYAREVAKTDRPFVITLNNEQNSLMRGYEKGVWLPLFRQSSAVITGYGYFAERADVDGQPFFNTCLKGDGDPYKDPKSKFFAREHNYLLLTFKAGADTMVAQFKNLQGAVLDSHSISRRN